MRTLYTTHAEPPKAPGLPRLAVSTFDREHALAMAGQHDDGRPPHETPESALAAAVVAAIDVEDAKRRI